MSKHGVERWLESLADFNKIIVIFLLPIVDHAPALVLPCDVAVLGEPVDSLGDDFLDVEEVVVVENDISVWEYDNAVVIVMLTRQPCLGRNVLGQSCIEVQPRCVILNPHAGIP